MWRYFSACISCVIITEKYSIPSCSIIFTIIATGSISKYKYLVLIFSFSRFFLTFFILYFLWIITLWFLLRFLILVYEFLGFNLRLKAFKNSTLQSISLLLALFPSSVNTNVSPFGDWIEFLLFLWLLLHIL